jgi:sec-independent protein translocase protein TatC
MPLDQESNLDKVYREIKQPELVKEMTFLEHLDELRSHLKRSIILVILMTTAAFFFKSFIFDVLIFGPVNLNFFTYRVLCEISYLIYNSDTLCIKSFGFQITNITMTGQFTMHLLVSFIVGIIVSFPFVTYELWRFIKPALSLSEQKKSKGMVLFIVLLFASGVLFGYFLLSPVSIVFMGSYSISDNIGNLINLESYVGFVTTLSLGAGLLFQLPLVIYFLAKIGLISASLLSKYRRYAFVIILIVSAIVTPPDPASQIILTIPIYLLYEFGIILAKKAEKQNLNTI